MGVLVLGTKFIVIFWIWYLIFSKFFSQNNKKKKIKKTAIFFENMVFTRYLESDTQFFENFFLKIFCIKKKTEIFFFFLDVVSNFFLWKYEWKYLYIELSFLLDISNWSLIFWKFIEIFFFFWDVVLNFFPWEY